MSNKKESRKANSGEERAREFVERLRQYDDFNGNVFDNIPLNFPRNFPIKIGQTVVGNASINWVAVIGVMVAAGASMSKPAEVSTEEHQQTLLQEIQRMAPDEVRRMLLPIHGIAIHMMEFLPEKFRNAITHLNLEGRHKIIIRREKQRGSNNIPSPAKFAEWVAKSEEEATRKRLPEIRGGSTPEIEISDEQCTKLAAEYPTLHTHWKNVRKWHKEGTNWRGHATLDQPDTPDDLLDKLNSLDPYDRQPATLAHEHAARRCGIPANIYSLRHLSRFRQRGQEILGQSNVNY